MTIYEIMEDARLEEVLDQVDNMSNKELMLLNNDYCYDNNYTDDIIYDNDENFFEEMYQGNIYQAVRDTNCVDYCYNDRYIKYTLWGLKSADWVADLIDTDMGDLASFALENDFPYLDNDEIERAGYDALIDALEKRYSDQVADFDDFYAFVSDNEDMDIEDALDEYNEYMED